MPMWRKGRLLPASRTHSAIRCGAWASASLLSPCYFSSRGLPLWLWRSELDRSGGRTKRLGFVYWRPSAPAASIATPKERVALCFVGLATRDRLVGNGFHFI